MNINHGKIRYWNFKHNEYGLPIGFALSQSSLCLREIDTSLAGNMHPAGGFLVISGSRQQQQFASRTLFTTGFQHEARNEKTMQNPPFLEGNESTHLLVPVG